MCTVSLHPRDCVNKTDGDVTGFKILSVSLLPSDCVNVTNLYVVEPHMITVRPRLEVAKVQMPTACVPLQECENAPNLDVAEPQVHAHSHQEITRVILCRLIYIIMSFKPFIDIIMIVCKFLSGLCCLRSYST